MGDISAHFRRQEFACRCGKCGFAAVDAELLAVLEDVHEHFDAPVSITSGNRCERHNAETPGAAPDSEHTKAMAADIKVHAVHPDRVADYLEAKYPDKYGVGRYVGRTHIDVRPAKARWDNR